MGFAGEAGPPEMKPMIAVLQTEPDANGSWAIHGFVQDRKGRGRPGESGQPTDVSLLEGWTGRCQEAWRVEMQAYIA